MSQYQKATNYILDFKKNIDLVDPKISSKLIGFLGEFYVCMELEKRGLNIIHRGGQAGFDILIQKPRQRIEVKTSLLKNEIYPNSSDYWGWRIQTSSQKRDHKFDILIAVALDKTFAKPKFYIFTYDEAMRVDNVSIKRFKKVKKKIHIFKSKKGCLKAIKSHPTIVTEYERYINKHKVQFLNRWSKIK